MTTAQVPAFRFEVDSDRDGVVEPGEPGRWDWQWRADGKGAIALADLNQGAGTRELTPVRLVVPSGRGCAIGINAYAAEHITVYRGADRRDAEPVLGVLDDEVVRVAGPFDGTQQLWLQPRRLPDAGFDGLIELTAAEYRMVGGPRPTGLVDRCVLRVAPWIIPPNTCDPIRVFAVAVPGPDSTNNDVFLADLQGACEKAGVELRVLDTTSLPNHPREPYDRWIQDEIEFGYIAGPGNWVPVVVDGPRNRGLDTIGTSGQLGAGIGALLLDADFDVTSSLDAFGNLEVSPPVTVDGMSYPLGRIVLGTKRASDDIGRKASLRLRQFLYGQRVQTPFEVYTDWLAVGHVDEIVSFVPSDEPPGFRTLIAAPNAAHRLFTSLAAGGLADATLWRGQRLHDGTSAEETVAELLGRTELWAFNEVCEEHLSVVRDQITSALGIADTDLVEVPVVFEEHGRGEAGAYFPDMVNQLVLGRVSVVPKPYGPVDPGGVDLLEQALRDLLPSGEVVFVDDWLSYHKLLGEVHCGTNVLRHPLTGVNWWEHWYDGVYDAAFPGSP
jgi:protein-arginine deiminase